MLKNFKMKQYIEKYKQWRIEEHTPLGYIEPDMSKTFLSGCDSRHQAIQIFNEFKKFYPNIAFKLVEVNIKEQIIRKTNNLS